MLRLFVLLVTAGSLLLGQGGQSDSRCMSDLSERFVLDTRSYWYGIGSAPYKKRDKSSFNKANSLALELIASSIVQDVKSSMQGEIAESISNTGVNFSEEFQFSLTTNTEIFIKDAEIIHQSKCRRDAYVVARLSKNSFIGKQPSIIKQYVNDSERLLSKNTTSTVNKLTNIDKNHTQLSIAKTILSLDSVLNNADLSNNMIQKLEEEYERLIYDIKVDFSLSSPLMSHTSTPIQLTLKVYDQKTGITIPNIPIMLDYNPSCEEIHKIWNKEKKCESNLLVSNAKGIARMDIDPNMKIATPVRFNAVVDIVSKLKDHALFQKYPSSNPDYNYTLETVPLVIKQKVDIDNKFLEQKLQPTIINLQRMIQNNVNATFNEDGAIYTLELRCDDVVQYIADNDQYVIKLHPKIYLINEKTNAIEFEFDFSKQKGLSWVGYDKAFKRINESINENIKEVSNGIIQALL
tara:strand:- start:841 stop:2229 length:1389 start_codon:yes stop_codon:yes gene_type:complete